MMLNPMAKFKITVLIVLLYATLHGTLLITVMLALRRVFGARIRPRARVTAWRLVFCALALLLLVIHSQNWRWDNLTRPLWPLYPAARFFLTFELPFVIEPDSGLYRYTGAAFLTIEQVSPDGSALLSVWSGEATRIVDLAFGIWLVGILVFWVWHLAGYLQLKRALRALPPAEDADILPRIEAEHLYLGIPEHVACRISARPLPISCPCIVGIFRPILLLTHDIWEPLLPPEREAVIAHELLHIRKRDNLRNLTLLLLQSVLWFHPLLWYGLRRFRSDLECLRDRQIIDAYRSPNQKKAYAQAILSVAKAAGRCYRSAMHSGMLNSSGLGFRIHLITDQRGSALLSAALPVLIGLLILWVCLWGIRYPVIQQVMQFQQS